MGSSSLSGSRSLRRLLAGAVGSCLALQWLVYALCVEAASPPLLLGLGVATIVAFALCDQMVRRCFGGYALAAERLSALARGDDWQVSLRVPALAGAGAARAELDGLRRRILERVDASQQLRAQAQEAAAYKVAFLRSVSHELRTPLNSILGFADVLLSDLEGPLTQDQRESLRVISAEGKRLSDLFSEVLELATLVSGEYDLEFEEVEVARLFEAISAGHAPSLAERVVHLRVEIEPGLASVTADEQRLQRMLGGLLGYALRVTSGNELVLSARQLGEWVELRLRDPQRSISKPELAQLLDEGAPPLRRLGLDEGSRLRLSICRHLSELHGGRFEVASAAADGTSFVVLLPATAARRSRG